MQDTKVRNTDGRVQVNARSEVPIGTQLTPFTQSM